MKLSIGARRALLVAACFGGVIAFSVAAEYLLALLPSTAEKCTAQCKVNGMEGHMVHIYSAAITAGMRGRGPEECKCFRPGTSP